MVLGGAVDALDPERLDRLARAVAPACEAWSLRAVSETGESLRVRQDIAEAPSRTRHQGVMITVTDQGGMGHAATADASEAGLRGAFAHARALARIMAGRGVVDFRSVPLPSPRGAHEGPREQPLPGGLGERFELLQSACASLRGPSDSTPDCSSTSKPPWRQKPLYCPPAVRVCVSWPTRATAVRLGTT